MAANGVLRSCETELKSEFRSCSDWTCNWAWWAVNTDSSRSIDNAIRLAQVSKSRRYSGSKNRCLSLGLTPKAPTVRCEPINGTNKAVALGSVSVPKPAV